MGARAGINTDAGSVDCPLSTNDAAEGKVGGKCAVRYDNDSRRVVSEWWVRSER